MNTLKRKCEECDEDFTPHDYYDTVCDYCAIKSIKDDNSETQLQICRICNDWFLSSNMSVVCDKCIDKKDVK